MAANRTISNEDRQKVEARRASYRSRTSVAGELAKVKNVRLLSIPRPGTSPIAAKLYEPLTSSTGPLPVIIYFHGGCFVSGDLDTHDAMLRILANSAQACIVIPDYRLAPEHPFPAGLDDCLAVTSWAASNADTFGGDATRMAVAGDSAGGNLAAVVSTHQPALGIQFRAQALLYPMLDATLSQPSMQILADEKPVTKAEHAWAYRLYLANSEDQRDERISPLHVASPADLPPTVIVTAGLDPLRDEGLLYAETLRQAGVDILPLHYPNMRHAFAQFHWLSENQPDGFEALHKAAEFLRTRL